MTKILALTGGIATGKSSVAQAFAAAGAVVLDADRLAHETYRPHTALYRHIVRRYGKGILLKNRHIDRQKLGDILFGSPQEKTWLETHIHPAVFYKIGRKIQAALGKEPPLILVESALHFETGYYRSFQGTVWVRTSRKQQIERLMARQGLNRAQALQRIASQISPRRAARLADWPIDNRGSLADTRRQVKKIFKQLIKT